MSDFDPIIESPLGKKTIEVFVQWLLESNQPIKDVVEAYFIIVKRFDEETRKCVVSVEGCEPLYPPAYPLVEKAFEKYRQERSSKERKRVESRTPVLRTYGKTTKLFR